MPGRFCHIELTTGDVERAKDFYGEVFGWHMEDTPMGEGTYTAINTGSEPGGGMISAPSPDVPTTWLVYMEVEDVAETLTRATGLGGRLIVEKTQIPGMGFFAVLSDPTGGVFGIWEPSKEEDVEKEWGEGEEEGKEEE